MSRRPPRREGRIARIGGLSIAEFMARHVAGFSAPEPIEPELPGLGRSAAERGQDGLE